MAINSVHKRVVGLNSLYIHIVYTVYTKLKDTLSSKIHVYMYTQVKLKFKSQVVKLFRLNAGGISWD